jgi:hypothetical protein
MEYVGRFRKNFTRNLICTVSPGAVITHVTKQRFVRMQIYQSAHHLTATHGWYGIPPNIRVPMYVNPFFFLTASFAPPKQLYPA